MFKIGDLVFAKMQGRGPSWPATVTKCQGNNQYQVKCFGTNILADVKTSALVTFSMYSLARFDTAKNRKIKEFVLALEQIREKRQECECSSGCFIPTELRQRVKLTIGDEGESEIIDIGKITLDNKSKTPKKNDKTPNKKRKAESVSDEKEVRIRGILSNRKASMIISPVPKRRRTVNFAQSPPKDYPFKDVTSTPLPFSGLFTELCSLRPHSENPQRTSLFQVEAPENLKSRKESENVLKVASNIVEELNETRENIKKIMDMNQTKEQTIHYLSLLMNEKKLIENEHDKALKGNEMTKTPIKTQANLEPSFCNAPEELGPLNDLCVQEDHDKIVNKKRISLISAQILEIDNDTQLDYSDLNNCHQLELIKELEYDETKTVDTTRAQFPLTQIEKKYQNDNHPTTSIDQNVLSEMSIKPELCISTPNNISIRLDINSNKDCVKATGPDHPPMKQDIDINLEAASIEKSNHLANRVAEITAKTVDSCKGKEETNPRPKLEIEEDPTEVVKSTTDDSNKQDKRIVDDTEVEFKHAVDDTKEQFKETNEKDNVSTDDSKEQVKLTLKRANVKHTLDDVDSLPKLELKEDIMKLDDVTVKPLDNSNSSDSSEADVSSDDFSDSEL